MANLNTLFDIFKFEKRKAIGQEQFEEANKQLLVDFVGFVDDAFKQTLRGVGAMKPGVQDNYVRARVMNNYVKEALIVNYPWLCSKATKQRFCLFVNGTYVYIKKLKETTFLPSNIPTDNSLLIHGNRTNSPGDRSPILFLGWTIPEYWSSVTGVYATSIEGKTVNWRSDLQTFAYLNRTPIIHIKPETKKPQVREGAKSRKRKNE